MIEEIQWCINDVPVFLVRKNIKNYYIRIKAPDAKVMVSVPVSAAHGVIEDFIMGHWDWIM